MPVVLATFTPNSEKLEAVEAALIAIAPAVHLEDGCELYALHRGKNRVVVVEKWRDSAALHAHGTGSNVTLMNEQLSGLVAEPPDVQVLHAIPAGETPKGAI